MLQVSGVKMSSSIGTQIGFTSDKMIPLGRFIELSYKDEKHYFEVCEIESIDSNHIHVTAVEVGYWAKRFKENMDFNILDIIFEELTEVTDPNDIMSIQKSTRLC